jgi:ubiquinone/menaquinone biosynthesis C-methylase UbiE
MHNRSVGPAAFVRLVHEGMLTQAIFAAAELGVADLLEEGPKDSHALARRTRCHEPSLRRLMRALVSLGLCRECDGGLFELTATGAVLCGQGEDSLHCWTLMCGRHMRPLWDHLLQSIKDGTVARKLTNDSDGFGTFESDAESAPIFNNAMAEITRRIAAAVVRAYDFTALRRVVDVGGGHGLLLAGVLRSYPLAHGILLDLPHVIDGAVQLWKSYGLSERCEFVAGDFFESIPGAGDAYLLKAVLHDWDDERCETILLNCRRVMTPSARLVIVERVMPARVEPCPSHRGIVWSDLSMMVGFGGRERTEADFRRLLAATGFKLSKVVATAFDFCVIEGIPCSARNKQ